MAARTLLFEVGGDGDVRTEMNGNTLCRPLPSLLLTTGWTKLRLGFRIAMSNTGSNITGTPRLAFGLCSGTTNPFDNGSGTTTNFIGAISDIATWDWFAGFYRMSIALTDFRACTRIGTTLALGDGLRNGPAQIQITTSAIKRQVFFLDITKGSPNYTLQWYHPTSEGTATDISLIAFKAQAVVAVPILSQLVFGAAVEIAASEVAGTFNALNISWDRSAPFFYVSDFIVVRLA